jgi:tripartite-type tricarboxylate transporter receptor subunit TctC
MGRKGRHLLWILASVCMTFTLPGWSAQAQQAFPSRSIDIIVPTAAGGGADVIARLVSEHLKKKWGVVVNVVNKPGGNTIIGNSELHQAKPDGYTVMADAQSGTMLLEVSSRNLPFKILDRTFVAVVVVSPLVFNVPSASPIKSLKDLEAEIKKDPDHFTWASFAGPQELLVRQFFHAIGVDITKTKPIASKGGSDSAAMVAGNHVKMAIATPVACVSHVRAGTTRAVAITGSRISDLPDVPTTVEQGYPAANAVFYQGFSGPPKMPASILNKWCEALQQIVKDPEFVSKVKDLGYTALYLGPDEAKEIVRKGMEEARILWGVK